MMTGRDQADLVAPGDLAASGEGEEAEAIVVDGDGNVMGKVDRALYD